MDTHARYMFDAVFATANAGTTDGDLPRHSDRTLEQARDAAYQQGLADGRIQTLNETTETVDQQVSNLLEQMQSANRMIAIERENIEGEACKLAWSAAETLASHLIAREPDGELVELFGECISHLRDAPQLVVHVAQGTNEQLGPRLTSIAEERGIEVAVKLIPDCSLADGDCRIVWSGGEISRDTSELTTTIRQIIERRFGSDASTEASPEPAETENTESPIAEGACNE